MEDIYIGIASAIEKINQFYNNMSPKDGVSLIKDPSMKKDTLKDSLGWKDDWANSSFECLVSTFLFYMNSVTPSTILRLELILYLV